MLFLRHFEEKRELSVVNLCVFAATSAEHFSHAMQRRRLGRDLAIRLNDTNA
jgi:hypothetical protein